MTIWAGSYHYLCPSSPLHRDKKAFSYLDIYHQWLVETFHLLYIYILNNNTQLVPLELTKRCPSSVPAVSHEGKISKVIKIFKKLSFYSNYLDSISLMVCSNSFTALDNVAQNIIGDLIDPKNIIASNHEDQLFWILWLPLTYTNSGLGLIHMGI